MALKDARCFLLVCSAVFISQEDYNYMYMYVVALMMHFVFKYYLGCMSDVRMS